MHQLAFILFAALLLLAAVQAALAGAFVRILLRGRRAENGDITHLCAAPSGPFRQMGNVPVSPLPPAAILLSLRGADPYLAKGLRCLMQQDYPDYELHIVVDRRDDPAWEVAEQAMALPRRAAMYLQELKEPLSTCSRKCSALVQMVSALDESREVVVLADADLVSHAGWLRELVAPLADPRVGAAFGNRWFMPRNGRWGSLVRYLWNAAAVVPMWLYNIPWGGTFAIRRKVLRDCGLVEKWSRAVVEDAPMRQALEEQGLRLRFVPSLMMVNREDCTLPFGLDFVKRQLTWTRWYHPNWSAVVIHAIVTTAIMAAALLLGFAGWIAGDAETMRWAAGGIGVYLATMLVLTGVMESNVRRVVQARGEPTAWLSPRVLLRLPVAVLLAQAIHLIAVLLAMFKRRVAWRGATYWIAGPWQVRLISDCPQGKQREHAESNLSL